MKKSLLLICLIILFCRALTQPLADYRRELDTTALTNWPFIESYDISNNGNYVLYVVKNGPAGKRTLHATSGDKMWKAQYENIYDKVELCEKSQTAIFIKSFDTLCIAQLGTANIQYISGVETFTLAHNGEKDILCFRIKTSAKLVIRIPGEDKQTIVDDVQEYLIHKNGGILVAKKQLKENGQLKDKLIWMDLSTNTSTLFWTGRNIGNLVFDRNGSKICFSGTQNDEININSFWCYDRNRDSTILIKSPSYCRSNDLYIENVLSFTEDGKKILVNLKENTRTGLDLNTVKVDVWSYTDVRLQSEQLQDNEPHYYFGLIGLEDSAQTFVIQGENERVLSNQWSRKFGNLYLISNSLGDNIFNYEKYWNKAIQPTNYLVLSNQKLKKRLPDEIDYFQISPGGRFIIGEDRDRINVYAYDIETGLNKNITQKINIPIGDGGYDRPSTIKNRGFNVANWYKDDRFLVIEDKYDIWLVDPLGNNLPVNLTNHYGRKNQISFKIADIYREQLIAKYQEIIVSALDQKSKRSGFYKIKIGRNVDPQLLTMGPYYYDQNIISASRSGKVDLFVVLRESAEESPNLYVTKDFKSFLCLSDEHPEKEYRWLRSELISFRTYDNREEAAIIYKPDDFDYNKSYPLIITHYECRSDELYKFQRPGNKSGDLDISWFVSHNYLVAIPDIHYRIGEPGESAFNSIVGLAKDLSKMPWVDKQHIGLQGHSMGGYQTNYTIAHTALFAAAVGSSGFSDLISDYGSIEEPGSGMGHQRTYEIDQLRIGVPLSLNPDLYIKNSPIFSAHLITTPLLIVANKGDGRVPFQQGVEFFTALRRFGKKVWMLQYDGEGHGLEGEAQIDYLIRMIGFFDHYLKGTPPPRWMTRGIPAKLKGIDNGFDIDTEIKTPGPGLLK